MGGEPCHFGGLGDVVQTPEVNVHLVLGWIPSTRKGKRKKTWNLVRLSESVHSLVCSVPCWYSVLHRFGYGLLRYLYEETVN